MKKISFGLSVSEIQNAIKEVEKYKAELTYKAQLIAEKLAEEGVAIARVKVSEHDAIYSGELISSLNAEYKGSVPDGAVWCVYTDCNYACYVEFGTGIVGSESPHPDTSLVGWEYDVNEHGENGWYYFKNGSLHWTKGFESRPFMYETGKDLEKIVKKVVREVFKN